MKVIFFIAILVAIVVGQQCGTVYNPTCVTKGGNCTDTNAQCDDDMICREGICTPPTPIGGNCTQDMDCINHPTSQSYCWSNNTCQATTYNAKENETCSDLNQCNSLNLYCNNSWDYYSTGICLSYLSEGAACSQSAKCGLQLVCSLNVCVKQFSIPNGKECQISNQQNFYHRSIDCVPGSYCAKVNSSNIGQCTAVNMSSSNTPCNISNPVCTSPMETCTCENTDGLNVNAVCAVPQVFMQSQADRFATFTSCMVNNSCNFELLGTDGCCRDEFCIVNELISSQYTSQTKALQYKCGSKPFDQCSTGGDGLSRSQLIAIIVGVIGGVLAVILIAVIIHKRRSHEYKSI